MNYYPHHIGDYITATAHLTMLEDGAYRRLLDLYYSTEKQLPRDRKALYRLARARTKEEQEAVDVVVEEFFFETDDGWFHSRCDEEIEKARVLAERARTNGKKGGRPPKAKPSDNPDTKPEHENDNPAETQRVISGLAKQNPEQTQGEPSDNPTPKPPIPIPLPNIKDKAAAANISNTVGPVDNSPPLPPPVDKPDKPEPLGLDAPARYAVLIRRWEKERGKASKLTSSDPRLAVWAEKGVNEVQLREAYDLAVADRDDKGDITPINAGFLDAMLAKVLNPPGGDSALNRQAPPGVNKPWAATWSGIVAKGAEHGIEQGPNEPAPAFRARVFAAAGLTDDEKAVLRADYGVAV